MGIYIDYKCPVSATEVWKTPAVVFSIMKLSNFHKEGKEHFRAVFQSDVI